MGSFLKVSSTIAIDFRCSILIHAVKQITTKDKIEDFRRRHGYPSASQAVTALVERHDIAADIKTSLIEELRKEITKEATGMIVMQLNNLLIDVSAKFDKPLSKLAIGEIIRGLREVATHRQSSP